MTDFTPVNLKDFLGKEVSVILRNGKKVKGCLTFESMYPCYPYKLGSTCYTRDGKVLIDKYCNRDILTIWSEEPEIGKPKTLWEVMYEEKWCRSGCDEFCRIVEKWMAQFSSEGGDFSILTENIK